MTIKITPVLCLFYFSNLCFVAEPFQEIMMQFLQYTCDFLYCFLIIFFLIFCFSWHFKVFRYLLTSFNKVKIVKLSLHKDPLILFSSLASSLILMNIFRFLTDISETLVQVIGKSFIIHGVFLENFYYLQIFQTTHQ